LNINVEHTPWYKDPNNLWWLGGLLIKGAVVVGIVYLGYKLVIDPLFIESLDIKGKGVDRTSTGVAPTVTVASPEGSMTPTGSSNGNLSEGGTVFHAIRYTLESVKNSLNKLNPSYWFLTSNGDEFNSFIDYCIICLIYNKHMYYTNAVYYNYAGLCGNLRDPRGTGAGVMQKFDCGSGNPARNFCGSGAGAGVKILTILLTNSYPLDLTLPILKV